ncbi:hypothetical protein pdam_00022386 [Pocillopora damicornis]|uniref:Uncharacterized protein n=1 Tax=Pocillopora damicornis TaxID=46731 RepID=A0A3M6TIP7_POCDA|nr:hypothetical protein pdam_00022386 [Pocillopora damicornis]
MLYYPKAPIKNQRNTKQRWRGTARRSSLASTDYGLPSNKKRSLNSASEVKKWIPGIKKELDYYLDQLSGARKHRYPDTKMKEFEKKVEELENEYKSSQTEVKPKKICTPLLEKEDANSSDVQSGKMRDSADLLFTACGRTTHPSNDTCKINSKNIGGDLEHQRDHIDVGPKQFCSFFGIFRHTKTAL